MRGILWLILLFAAAVLAAATFGANDGLVTLFWPPWRVDLSLNLFVLLLLAGCLLVYLAFRLGDVLWGLPRRSRQWRAVRREHQAQQSLREGWAEFQAGRFTRACRAAERALKLHAELAGMPQLPLPTGAELAKDASFAMLAHALAAGSLHRLQDREGRDRHLEQALAVSDTTPSSGTAAATDGLRLMAAEWALEDRDADRAAQLIAAMPPGSQRRTQALRLRLQIARLTRESMEALRTARLLSKHQAMTPVVATSLTRSLAIEVLAAARDPDQLDALWLQLEDSDRRDVFVLAHAASRMGEMGQAEAGRAWLLQAWGKLGDLTPDERGALCRALASCIEGLDADWLPRVEKALERHGQEPDLVYAAGCAFAQVQLWGKARAQLTAAAQASGLAVRLRRDAWRRLARMAEEAGDEALAGGHYRQAAQLDD